jgi:hypothetical protein
MVDPRGRWRDLEHGGKQYRTDKGAVVNWWKASGKILFQGQGSAVSKFEQAFVAIASTKGRLEDKDSKSLRDLGRENETLRTLIADVLLENARLRKRLLISFSPSVQARADASRFLNSLI